MEPEIKHYIYLDSEGINQVYNQLPNIEYSSKVTTTEYLGGKLDSEIGSTGLGKILPVKVSANVDANHKIQEEHETTITLEQKVEFVLKYLGGKVEILSDVLEKNKKFESALIACKSIFRFVRAYDEDEERYVLQSEIRNDPYKYKNISYNFASISRLQFYYDDVDLLKCALDNNGYYVDMFFSGSKMTRGVRHLNNNIKYNKDFILHILGEITSEGHNIYCLKPYAIWRMTNRNM